MRLDIQGLRAIAVALVAIYHLWPERLTGGYVGVDVFFVISGFLITSQLVRTRPRRIRDFAGFWAKRVRRLLPAATLVLGATLVAGWLLMPSTTRRSLADNVVAACLYVENWFLAGSATDYLAQDDIPSPVQHYWSLSVEEQFYIVWPLLIGAAVIVASRYRRDALRDIRVAVVGVAVLSLAYSVYLAAVDPASAYFVTPTRMWELALGGVIAVFRLPASFPDRLRTATAWLGIGMMLASAVTYSGATAFPGYAALLPTIGCAAVILAAAPARRASPTPYLGLPPVRLLGDISYSYYLWHWPVITILPVVLGRDLRWPEKLGILAVVFLLAWLTKILVEDPIRESPALRASLPKTYAMGAGFMVIVVAASLLVGAATPFAASGTPLPSDIKRASCFGAEAARDPSCEFPGDSVVTSPEFAQSDKPDVYADHCWSSKPSFEHVTCEYGPRDSETEIALIGNSHAGHWQPALEELAEKNDWRVTTYLASICYPADVTIVLDTPAQTKACRSWTDWAIDQVKTGGYDLVVTSNRTVDYQEIQGVPSSQRNRAAQEGYSRVLQDWVDAGVPVLVIRDVPQTDGNPPDCVALHPKDPTRCSMAENRAVEPDPLAKAAAGMRQPDVKLLNLNDRLCRDGRCYSVIGGVIAYFNQGHMSKTFSETLAPDLEGPAEELLGAG